MLGHEVFLGAADWRYPHWSGAFYPVDMPDDWQLAYYGSQLSCLWLPSAVWRQALPASIMEWANDTRSAFLFVLEFGATTAEREAVVAGFGAGRAILRREDDPELVWFAADVDLRSLSDALRRRAAEPGRTFLLSRDGDLATLDKVSTLLDVLGLGPGGRVG